MQERIQKLISAAGLMSRRAAEKLITEGKVTVNGEPAQLGDRADPDTDEIIADGVKVVIGNKKTYVLLNKPRGYVTTLSDEKDRKNVAMLTEDTGVRLYPVGRLDINSEGLLIMTDDGELANMLMHPSGHVLKTYRTSVTGSDIEASIKKLAEPVELDDCTVQAKSVKLLKSENDAALVDITIGEGRNRQIRRMCEYCDLKVTRLVRVKEGPVELGKLKTGTWRYLTDNEIAALKGQAGYGQ